MTHEFALIQVSFPDIIWLGGQNNFAGVDMPAPVVIDYS